MTGTDFLLAVISALLALNLAQITGLRTDVKALSKRQNEQDSEIAGIKKVLLLNGCETPDPACKRGGA